MQILDYSGGYPPPDAIIAAGYRGVIRYLRKEGTSSVKPITPGEMAALRGAGCAVALIYEHVEATRATAGRVAGVHDAQWALARALELGAGEPRCVYFAVDFDAVPTAVDAYFTGCADILGAPRVGCYGSYRVVSYLLNQGLARWVWQTTAWSRGLRESRAHLFQRLGQVTVNGVSCDVNDVLTADYGQYGVEETDMTPEESGMLAGIDRSLGYTFQQDKKLAGQVISETAKAVTDLSGKVDKLSIGAAPEIDYTKLAALVVAGIGPTLAVTVADELDRRARDNDPATGPRT